MGPTEESNWVIYPRLLVGAYPSSVHDATNTSILSSILRLGATTFVCLQQEYQHEGVLEHEWRSGAKLRPYIFDAIKLIDKLPASFFPADRGKPSGLEFVHFPIQGACHPRTHSTPHAHRPIPFSPRPPSRKLNLPAPHEALLSFSDCSIANDSSVLQLARDLVKRLVRGETMYLRAFARLPPPQRREHESNRVAKRHPPHHLVPPLPSSRLLGRPRPHRHSRFYYARDHVRRVASRRHALGAILP